MAPLTQIPIKGDYSRRDFERSARFHGMPIPDAAGVPDRVAGAVAHRAVGEGTAIRRSQRRRSLGALSRVLRRRSRHLQSRRRGRCRGEAGFDRPRPRALHRRSGDQGRAEARGRRRDRARRLRLAVHRRRRRAVLGARPLRPDRALARDRRILRPMAEYMLHCFAQSGNAYKAALALAARGRRLGAALRRLFRRRDAHAASIARSTSWARCRCSCTAACALSQSGVILDYLAETLGQFGPADDAERREILRWMLFDNHKLTSYTATLRFMRTFAEGARSGGAGAFLRRRAEDGVGHARRASRRAPASSSATA